MNVPPLDLVAGRLDGIDARAIAVRLAHAARLAALPGTVGSVPMGDLRRHAADPANVADHSPGTGVRRICPDTGAHLLEMMLLAPVGPGRGTMTCVVGGVTGMRTLVVDTPLDIAHHGSDRIVGTAVANPPTRWPETSHAALRIAAAAEAMERLARELEAGRPAPGNHAVQRMVASMNSLAQVRVAALRDDHRTIHSHAIVAETPTPWTRASLTVTTYALAGPKSGDRVLAPGGDDAFLATFAPVAVPAAEQSTDHDGERYDRISFTPQTIAARSDEEEVDAIGNVAIMREAARLGLTPSDFAA